LPYKTTPTIEETFVNVAYTAQLDKALLLYVDNTKNIKVKGVHISAYSLEKLLNSQCLQCRLDKLICL